MTSLITLHDYERAAFERLDDNARGYFASGSDDERTLVDNQAAYGRHRLVPRVMVGVGHRDVSTAVLGTEIAMPIVIAPMAMQGMAHDAAERGMVGAARSADTVMVLSTISNTPIEEVVAARKGPVWFQLYVFQDRGATADLVRRAEAAGVEALVVTVDVPVLGQREADLRNQFTMPAHLSLPNVADSASSTQLSLKNVPESAVAIRAVLPSASASADFARVRPRAVAATAVIMQAAPIGTSHTPSPGSPE